MDCRLCREQLSAYLDGEVDRTLARQVEDHLTRCKPCRTEFAELKRVRELVTALPQVPAPEELALEVNAHLERRALLEPSAGRERRSLLVRTLGGIAAVAAVALVAVGVYHFMAKDQPHTGPHLVMGDLDQSKVARSDGKKDAANGYEGAIADKAVREGDAIRTKMGYFAKSKAADSRKPSWDGPTDVIIRGNALNAPVDRYAYGIEGTTTLHLELVVADPDAARTRILQVASTLHARPVTTVGFGKTMSKTMKKLKDDGEPLAPAPTPRRTLARQTERPGESRVVTLLVEEEKLPELVKELMASRQKVAGPGVAWDGRAKDKQHGERVEKEEKLAREDIRQPADARGEGETKAPDRIVTAESPRPDKPEDAKDASGAAAGDSALGVTPDEEERKTAEPAAKPKGEPAAQRGDPTLGRELDDLKRRTREAAAKPKSEPEGKAGGTALERELDENGRKRATRVPTAKSGSEAAGRSDGKAPAQPHRTTRIAGEPRTETAVSPDEKALIEEREAARGRAPRRRIATTTPGDEDALKEDKAARFDDESRAARPRMVVLRILLKRLVPAAASKVAKPAAELRKSTGPDETSTR